MPKRVDHLRLPGIVGKAESLINTLIAAITGASGQDERTCRLHYTDSKSSWSHEEFEKEMFIWLFEVTSSQLHQGVY